LRLFEFIDILIEIIGFVSFTKYAKISVKQHLTENKTQNIQKSKQKEILSRLNECKKRIQTLINQNYKSKQIGYSRSSFPNETI